MAIQNTLTCYSDLRCGYDGLRCTTTSQWLNHITNHHTCIVTRITCSNLVHCQMGNTNIFHKTHLHSIWFCQFLSIQLPLYLNGLQIRLDLTFKSVNSKQHGKCINHISQCHNTTQYSNTFTFLLVSNTRWASCESFMKTKHTVLSKQYQYQYQHEHDTIGKPIKK